MPDLCLAPDANLRAPRFKLPPGSTDTHFHLFGPLSTNLLVPERDYTPADAPANAARRMFDAFGIDRIVVVQPSVHGRDNSDQLEEATKIGLPFRAVVVLAADAPDAEMDRLHALGARGIRYILAHPGGLDLGDLERSAERAHERGWNLQFLLKPQHLVELESRLSRLHCDIVIDHLGFVDVAGPVTQPGFAALMRLVQGGNGWAKLSGAYRTNAEEPTYEGLKPFVRALIDTRPDRLIWGSDWPHVGMKQNIPDTTNLLDLLFDFVDERERRGILVDNPSTLFRW